MAKKGAICKKVFVNSETGEETGRPVVGESTHIRFRFANGHEITRGRDDYNDAIWHIHALAGISERGGNCYASAASQKDESGVPLSHEDQVLWAIEQLETRDALWQDGQYVEPSKGETLARPTDLYFAVLRDLDVSPKDEAAAVVKENLAALSSDEKRALAKQPNVAVHLADIRIERQKAKRQEMLDSITDEDRGATASLLQPQVRAETPTEQ